MYFTFFCLFSRAISTSISYLMCCCVNVNALCWICTLFSDVGMWQNSLLMLLFGYPEWYFVSGKTCIFDVCFCWARLFWLLFKYLHLFCYQIRLMFFCCLSSSYLFIFCYTFYFVGTFLFSALSICISLAVIVNLLHVC